jgi:7,8-dihydropterin-6-yl-methyl-4-(beta-D-ribofuranosyl)aminobenzene 5'-phosphate synthase
VRITILYDNRRNGGEGDVIAGSGFSALIEGCDKTVLFDVGADSLILSRNMKNLGIDPRIVDAVFLSHDHCDHIGGLSAILRHNPTLEVYVPEASNSDLKDKVKASESHLTCVTGPLRLAEHMQTTGQMEGSLQGIRKVQEHGLVLQTPKGSVLVVGCAHPGIMKIVERSEAVSRGQGLYLVVGGFHLLEKSESEIRSIVHSLRARAAMAAPCHCTGDEAIEVIERVYGQAYIKCGVGRRIFL